MKIVSSGHMYKVKLSVATHYGNERAALEEALNGLAGAVTTIQSRIRQLDCAEEKD